jgi:hypothetical protein
VGVEKRKYSFATPPTGKGANYTLHVEIELQYPSGDAFLTDIRLAVRTVQDVTQPGWWTRLMRSFGFRADPTDIDKEAKRLVYYFVSKITQPMTPQERLDLVLKRHFAFSDDDIKLQRA